MLNIEEYQQTSRSSNKREQARAFGVGIHLTREKKKYDT
jgi:hypothetical protein